MDIKNKTNYILNLLGIKYLFKKILQIAINEILEKEPRYFVKVQRVFQNTKIEETKRKLLNVGFDLRINGEITITHPRAIIIGNNVHIGGNAYIYSRAGVVIGDNTHISRNLTLYTSSHQYQGNCLPYDSGFIDKPVSIGANVWIGMNVNILPGVNIGDGSIIGMGTTVSKDVPKGAVVTSAGQRVVKYRDFTHYDELNSKRAYGGANGIKLPIDYIKSYQKSAADLGENLFFVLSTGRAGSTTIAKVLSQHDEIECMHEPKLSLVRLSTDYLHGKISEAQVELELENLYLKSGIINSTIFGESDQKLSNLVGIIHKILPKAKFIWLIREPKQTINSTFSRGWFSDHELGFGNKDKLYDPLYRGIYSDYRPQADLANQLSQEEWQTMTEFERNCWYWYYWNKMIQTQLALIEPSLWIKIKLEEIEQNTAEILEFLGAKPTKLAVFSTNKAEKRYTLKDESSWSKEMVASYEKWCGEDILY